jgi:hypothetical protein
MRGDGEMVGGDSAMRELLEMIGHSNAFKRHYLIMTFEAEAVLSRGGCT